VYKYCPHADNFGCGNDSRERVLQKVLSETTPSWILVTRQSADDGNRNLIWETLNPLHLGRQGASFYASSCNAVVADNDNVFFAHNVGARSFSLAFQRTIFKPIIEGRLSAMELAYIMRGSQTRGTRYALARCWVFTYLRHLGCLFIRALSFGPAGGGLSRAFTNESYWSGSRTKSL
jgi:hypothetical protein